MPSARTAALWVQLAMACLCEAAAQAGGVGADTAPVPRHLLAARASSSTRLASSSRARRSGAFKTPDPAARQWADWRSRLFGNVMAAYKRLELEHMAATEPVGHRVFDLFSPFVGCPGGRPPALVGGARDGGKYACMDALLEPECVVYSLVGGSTGWTRMASRGVEESPLGA